MALLDDHQEMDSEKLAKIRFLGFLSDLSNMELEFIDLVMMQPRKKIQSKIPLTKFAFRFDSNTLLKGYLDTT